MEGGNSAFLTAGRTKGEIGPMLKGRHPIDASVKKNLIHHNEISAQEEAIHPQETKGITAHSTNSLCKSPHRTSEEQKCSQSDLEFRVREEHG